SGEKLNCTVCEIYLSHLCAASSLSSRSKRVGDDVGMAAQCEEAEKKYSQGLKHFLEFSSACLKPCPDTNLMFPTQAKDR
ncbi:MAG TPA: hypothetical protein VGT04_05885, partial [Acidobacteriaceae bacterium]|nr:hypothetical protein [Acidobacteriaceae bacterium]